MVKESVGFVMNGELYLKRGPEVFKSDEWLDYYDDIITDIEFDASKENPDFSKYHQLDRYQDLKDTVISLDGELDYSGTNSFWQLFTNDGIDLKLIKCEYIPKEVKTYKNKKSLDKNFIKLSIFLEKATFIGRQFVRTKPTKDSEDYSYMKLEGYRYIALYCMQDLFLIKYIAPGLGERYALMNSMFTLDGNYEFFGPVHEEYRDKNKVYSEILAQINDYNKGMGRNH